MKELDLSKAQIDSDHVTDSFLQMIKSEFCTLKSISLRDNFIKQEAAEQIFDSLKMNKTIIKMHLDYNPIKQSLISQIDLCCKRNHNLDTVNEKNKNVQRMLEQQKRAASQKQTLKQEIKNLKKQTDKTIKDATIRISEIEDLQQSRKTSANFFMTVVPQLGSTCNVSRMDSSAVPEPKTTLSTFTKVTFCSSALTAQHERHKSQGPMRSEKVYILTKLIKQKTE